ncbi:MAG: Fur family zinc uptake transcriptional regulator [Parasphingorhabdus sp.]|jgi:Fur family zinc uptake transcriptional regulator|uniref:Fur family transcriptional regulator n=1 Tax=Parasphingorhabdus sp. TaxID=2709688 RepID=UPI001B6F76F2|nr:transcriptional repressor [Parasphingorhabdus sp.]MBQ0771855.1 transcriptional repressor [Sphingomonadales bacterium]|tara:strand:- start:121 stop:579 length:459 start_codon:yes stop_codon:yes gene_type:complete
MGKHDHHEHQGDSLADAARSNLEKSGEKWTDTRAAIFDTLAGFSRPASAYDIAELVSAARGKRVAPNSVYRILDLFVANNLAMRVESANAYLANSHPGCEHDCIFLVCDTCGEATHVDDDSLSQQVRKVATAEGFKSIRPVIEVRGICQKCN